MGELKRLLVKCIYSLLDKACQRFGAGIKCLRAKSFIVVCGTS